MRSRVSGKLKENDILPSLLNELRFKFLEVVKIGCNFGSFQFRLETNVNIPFNEQVLRPFCAVPKLSEFLNYPDVLTGYKFDFFQKFYCAVLR